MQLLGAKGPRSDFIHTGPNHGFPPDQPTDTVSRHLELQGASRWLKLITGLGRTTNVTQKSYCILNKLGRYATPLCCAMTAHTLHSRGTVPLESAPSPAKTNRCAQSRKANSGDATISTASANVYAPYAALQTDIVRLPLQFL